MQRNLWEGGVAKIPKKMKNMEFSKMPPKLVDVLVLGSQEHFELGLILQNWPFARPPKSRYWVKNQSYRKWVVWPFKMCARRALSQWKKIESISPNVFEKSPKNHLEEPISRKPVPSSGFWDFSQKRFNWLTRFFFHWLSALLAHVLMGNIIEFRQFEIWPL